MKKSVIFMCIGGMLALCTPLAASDAVIEPPIVKHIATEKNHAPVADPAEASDLTKTSAVNTTDESAAPASAHTGGVVVISGTALLLIIILLILLV